MELPEKVKTYIFRLAINIENEEIFKVTAEWRHEEAKELGQS